VRVFALEEAAEQIKASKRWLADQARAGTIPARKIGGKWVFVEADLVEILERFRNDRLRSKTSPDDFGLTTGSSRRRDMERALEHRRRETTGKAKADAT
jgi:Helix-turn-helix domain